MSSVTIEGYPFSPSNYTIVAVEAETGRPNVTLNAFPTDPHATVSGPLGETLFLSQGENAYQVFVRGLNDMGDVKNGEWRIKIARGEFVRLCWQRIGCLCRSFGFDPCPARNFLSFSMSHDFVLDLYYIFLPAIDAMQSCLAPLLLSMREW